MTLTEAKETPATSRAATWALFVVDAGLMVTSGVIHLHLWDIAYRHVATLGPLFLVQAIAGLILAVAVLVTRNILVIGAALVLMAGTIGGFILVRTVGLFGFRLTFTSGLAYTVLIVEIVAVAALALTGALLLRGREQAR